MTLSVRWAPEAETDLARILEYLHDNWEEQVSLNFLKIVAEAVSEIRKYPQHYPIIEQHLSVRRFVLTKHNSLYYQFNENELWVLRIYDTRQDPNKLLFK